MKNKMNQNSEKLKSFTPSEHFFEFKKRLIFILLFFIASLFFTYHFKENILEFLTLPLKEIDALNNDLIFTHITEPFFVYLKVVLWSSLFISVPFILYQLFKFASCGLFKNEKIFLSIVLFLGIILFYCGMAFVYFALMPNIFSFFLSFADNSSSMQFYAKISEYFSFSLHLMLAFGLAFQLPILLIALNKIGLISYKSLQNKRKYSIVIIAFASAVLTPPDVFTQMALIIPLVILYELTILLLKISGNDKIL